MDSKDTKSADMTRAAMTKEEEKSMSPFERMLVAPWERLAVGGPEGAAVRKEFGEKFMSRLSTANLILLPIFALLFKMLYVRRSKYYVEHLVFALHYYAFFSIGATLILLISKITPLHAFHYSVSLLILDIPIVLWMLAYMPVAMFVNYQQGVIKTFIKCWIFWSIYVFAIGLVLTGIMYYTVYELPEPPPLVNKRNSAPKVPTKSPVVEPTKGSNQR
jgi:hypothetical protein